MLLLSACFHCVINLLILSGRRKDCIAFIINIYQQHNKLIQSAISIPIKRNLKYIRVFEVLLVGERGTITSKARSFCLITTWLNQFVMLLIYVYNKCYAILNERKTLHCVYIILVKKKNIFGEVKRENIIFYLGKDKYIVPYRILRPLGILCNIIFYLGKYSPIFVQ
jgi:hypothetical protein